MMKLIISADDFGLTPGINKAIVELFENDALSDASILITANYVNDAIAKLKGRFHDRIGLHLCLYGQKPASPPEQIPTLIYGENLINKSALIRGILFGSVSSKDIACETRAQINRMFEIGIPPTYLDSHGHFHVVPKIAKIVAPIAHEYGIPVRRPIEFANSMKTGFSGLIRMPIVLAISIASLITFKMYYGMNARTDQFIGLIGSGKKNYFKVVHNYLSKIQASGNYVSIEVLCHPGHLDDALIQYGDKGWNRDDDYNTAMLLKKHFPTYIWKENMK